MKRKTRKEVLYEEAAMLFKEKGYPASSVRELAVRVGIEPSSIYSHVRSKEELLVKICMDTAHYFANGMNEILNTVDDPIEKIEKLIDLHVDAVRVLPSSVTVFTDEWKHLPEEAKNEFINIRNTYQSKWVDILKEGMDRKMIKVMEPRYMKDMVLSALRWVHYISEKKDLSKLKQITEDIKTILFGGIRL